MTARDLSVLAHAGDFRVAPDGGRIAYTVITVDTEANGYRTRIWLADVNASASPRPLTAGAWADTLPRWSPDGRRSWLRRRFRLGRRPRLSCRRSRDGATPDHVMEPVAITFRRRSS